MKNYQDIAHNVIATGNVRETRSGNVTSTFVQHFHHDMTKGFPCLTTKKLNLNAVTAELLFFLNGVSDRRIMQEYQHGKFVDDVWDIWKDDCTRANKSNPIRFNVYNLGEIYPEMWRKLYSPTNEHIKFKKLTDLDVDYKEPKFPLFDGVRKITNSGFEYIKIHGGKTKSKIQFVETGYICEVDSGAVSRNNLKDPMSPSVYGIGYLGRIGYVGNSTVERLKRIWKGMISRCYNSKDPNYKNYGEIGVIVSPRWLNRENFINDCYCLPNFQKWVDGDYQLDKDYLSGDVYSRNTCVFLPTEINNGLRGDMYVVDDKIFMSVSACKEYLKFDNINSNKTKQFMERVVVPKDGVYLHRPKMFTDQITNLINGIINNPTSRYHLVDTWNVNYKNVAVLGACHNMFQCYVDGDYLDLHWNQRSVDVALGLPYNIASYGLLLVILAKLTGKIPRILTATLLDTHVYEDHEGDLVKQILRTPKKLPTIKLPEFNTLDELLECTAEDFELVDYEHHDPIKYKLSVG